MVRGSVLVLLGGISFGIVSSFVKFAYADGYSLGDVTGAQALVGVIMLWSLCFFQKRSFRGSTTSDKKSVIQLLVSGVTTGLVSIFYYKCVREIEASVAIILLMQFTWISLLIEFLVFRKKPDILQLFAVVLILAGTIMASGLLNIQSAEISSNGIVMGLLAAFCYAVFLIVNARVGNDVSAIKKSALMLTGSCIFIFVVFPPVFLFNGAMLGSLGKWSIVLALFASVIPPVFFAKGIPRIGVGLATILSTIELPVAVAMSYFVLNEPVDLLRWLGVFLIMAALILPNLERKPDLVSR